MTNPYRAMCAELLAWAEHTSSHYYKQPDVLTRARALLAQQPVSPPYKLPEPEGPTDEELLAMRSWSSHGHTFDSDLVDYARAVLTRFGRPTPRPVAVSERLPGPEDCDTEGSCWWFDPHADGAWYVDTFQSCYTHWLSANAPPTPIPPMNEPLSPAAQAVLDAVTAELDWDARYHSHTAAAAALRAAADQVVPVPKLPYDSCCDVSASAIRTQLLAIAAELEAQ